MAAKPTTGAAPTAAAARHPGSETPPTAPLSSSGPQRPPTPADLPPGEPPRRPITRKRAASINTEEANRPKIENLSLSTPSTAGSRPFDAGRDLICLCTPRQRSPTEKRQLSPFILYRQHHQAQVVQDNPGLANPEISKIIGEQWRQEPEERKNQWKRLAEEEKQRHQRTYPDYRYQPRRGNKSGGSQSTRPAAAPGEDPHRCTTCGGRFIATPRTPSTPFMTPTSSKPGSNPYGPPQVSQHQSLASRADMSRYGRSIHPQWGVPQPGPGPSLYDIREDYDSTVSPNEAKRRRYNAAGTYHNFHALPSPPSLFTHHPHPHPRQPSFSGSGTGTSTIPANPATSAAYAAQSPNPLPGPSAMVLQRTSPSHDHGHGHGYNHGPMPPPPRPSHSIPVPIDSGSGNAAGGAAAAAAAAHYPAIHMHHPRNGGGGGNDFDESLRLPPLQTHHLLPASSASPEPYHGNNNNNNNNNSGETPSTGGGLGLGLGILNPGSGMHGPSSSSSSGAAAGELYAAGGGGVKWERERERERERDAQARSVEAMVMSISYVNKLKVLERISPPLGSGFERISSGAGKRGPVIAVEGPDVGAVRVVAGVVERAVRGVKGWEVRCWEDGEGAGVPRGDDVVMGGMGSGSRHGSQASVASASSGGGGGGDSNAFTAYLRTITDWHAKSAEMVRFVTGTTNRQNQPHTTHPNRLLPIALLPAGYALTLSDRFACAVPIADAYAPVDHWQWMATLWRGVVGADLVVYVAPRAVPFAGNNGNEKKVRRWR
ncbi:hypothetical protein NEMBOFW57_010106 [Staphylotrichum longicolle]|uniref:HMG box domain-containing protein n=1 Tax=Staphylotrichum longicolle TaxID=669026 RepID=A0AAD4EQ65_9PEZI|nr:hypothetical protein NEMBOFW57_010106 [Staphylotrichum longicolle]